MHKNLLIYQKADQSYVFLWDDERWQDCKAAIGMLFLRGVFSVREYCACLEEGAATMNRKVHDIRVRVAE